MDRPKLKSLHSTHNDLSAAHDTCKRLGLKHPERRYEVFVCQIQVDDFQANTYLVGEPEGTR